MNWNEQKSLRLSRISVALFMVALAVLDVAGYWVAKWYLSFPRYTFWGNQPLTNATAQILLLISLYACSVPAWVVLRKLHGLLARIEQGHVFVAQNVAALRSISWCCLLASGICLLSGAYHLPFFLLSLVAGFVALVVRVVKNCFEQAVGMREELDFTI